MRILITSDNHLGYKETDPVLSMDSFNAFEDVLKSGRDCDLMVIAGDLFHSNRPTRFTLHRTIRLLKENVLGSRAIRFRCNKRLNYARPDMNIALPVVAINGNHDDPCGHGSLSALDVMHETGLLNYVGKVSSHERIVVEPLIVRAERTVALYCLSHVRDSRLHGLFERGRVEFLRAEADVCILVVHQNRVERSRKDFLPAEFVPAFFSLVVFGHEHDPLLFERNGQTFLQCGSTVRTSLCEAETGEKFCYRLEVGEGMRIEKVRVGRVRPFFFDTTNKTGREEIRAKLLEMLRGAARPCGSGRSNCSNCINDTRDDTGDDAGDDTGDVRIDRRDDTRDVRIDRRDDSRIDTRDDTGDSHKDTRDVRIDRRDDDSRIDTRSNTHNDTTQHINTRSDTQRSDTPRSDTPRSDTRSDIQHINTRSDIQSINKRSDTRSDKSINFCNECKPLVRLRLEHDIQFNKFQLQAEFADSIANTDIFLLVKKRRAPAPREKAPHPSRATDIYGILKDHLLAASLSILPELPLVECVREYVEKESRDALAEFVGGIEENKAQGIVGVEEEHFKGIKERMNRRFVRENGLGERGLSVGDNLAVAVNENNPNVNGLSVNDLNVNDLSVGGNTTIVNNPNVNNLNVNDLSVNNPNVNGLSVNNPAGAFINDSLIYDMEETRKQLNDEFTSKNDSVIYDAKTRKRSNERGNNSVIYDVEDAKTRKRENDEFISEDDSLSYDAKTRKKSINEFKGMNYNERGGVKAVDEKRIKKRIRKEPSPAEEDASDFDAVKYGKDYNLIKYEFCRRVGEEEDNEGTSGTKSRTTSRMTSRTTNEMTSGMTGKSSTTTSKSSITTNETNSRTTTSNTTSKPSTTTKSTTTSNTTSAGQITDKTGHSNSADKKKKKSTDHFTFCDLL